MISNNDKVKKKRIHGAAKDTECRYATALDPKLEQWRVLAAEWLATLKEGKSHAMAALKIFGYFKSGVANAAHEACGLKAEKSSLPAIRNSTVRMVLKLAYPRALRLAA